jgi:hypothetical protein
LRTLIPFSCDQPEDNLDNAFTAEIGLVAELREGEADQSAVLVRHTPHEHSGVRGDAEWIGVFTAAETKGVSGWKRKARLTFP